MANIWIATDRSYAHTDNLLASKTEPLTANNQAYEEDRERSGYHGLWHGLLRRSLECLLQLHLVVDAGVGSGGHERKDHWAVNVCWSLQPLLLWI